MAEDIACLCDMRIGCMGNCKGYKISNIKLKIIFKR